MLTKKIAIATLALAASAGASANLILGGGFNSEADLAFWANISEGSGNVSIQPCCGLAPQEGAGHLAFTGNSGDVQTDWYGGLFQGVNLVLGREYALSYYWAGRGQTSTQESLSVGVTTGFFNTADVLENTYQTNATVGVWTQETVKFIATTSDITWIDLAEIASDSSSKGPALDNISLKEIPVPGSLALMGLGLMGLSLRGRRKK